MIGETLLQVEALSYGTPDRRVLASGLQFSLASGQLLHVTGPNGAGKSTLLQVLLGQIRPLSGSVNVLARSVAVIPQVQNNHFHIPVTLRDVIRIGVRHSVDDLAICSQGLLEKSHLDLAWNTASGGERKRTLLTRALLQNPELLVLDEPMNHLDEASRVLIGERIAAYVKDHGRTSVAMVSHYDLVDHGLDIVQVPIGTQEARA